MLWNRLGVFRTPKGRPTEERCVCSCGRTSWVPLVRGELRTGSCRACAPKHTVHGMCRRKRRSPIHRVWTEMIQRCTNPNNAGFPGYGGRGIRVCERWHSFENFLADMGPRPSPRHSIDRVDNDGDYEPSNCRWATVREQARNNRRNRWLTFDGETRLITEWADRLGIGYMTIHYRLTHGWSVERALSTPVMSSIASSIPPEAAQK